MLLLLALGTLNHQRRLARFGADSPGRAPPPVRGRRRRLGRRPSRRIRLARRRRSPPGRRARRGCSAPIIPPSRHFGMVRDVMLHVLRAEALDGPILANSQALIDYLFADMAHLPAERLRVLFLNAKNRLLRDEMVTKARSTRRRSIRARSCAARSRSAPPP